MWTIFLMLGCGDAPTPEEPLRPTSNIEVLSSSSVTVADNWSYQRAGKRDPFYRPFRIDDPPSDGCDVSLQCWSVEQYVLKGIIFGNEQPAALLVDPNGLGHVVKMGSYVGRNWGKVTSIADQQVVVTEEYRTVEQDLVVNPVVLRL